MRKTIAKYCYMAYPFITIIILSILYFICLKFNFKLDFANNMSESLIQISGSLIGFLLTAITVFLSLPKDNKIMQRVKKYNHHRIFGKCIFSGLLILSISIFLWIFKAPEWSILMSFIFGLEEVIISAYYVYILCIYNFE